MDWFLLISLILTVISGISLITRHYQMLQQNSYFPSRYTKWLKGDTGNLSTVFFFCASILFCQKNKIFLMIFSLLVAVFFLLRAVSVQKKSIKPLVLTARVKRLYAVTILILILSVVIYTILPQALAGRISASVCLILSYVSPILVYLSWAICNPIEKAFTRYYINDAKKILKSHKNLKVIGITGSYGKTTSKFILTRILSEKYNVLCTPQSFNTPMGVVRTIRESLKPQTDIFVCEMGAKNIGDIKEICDIVNPDMGMITSVGAQHLETFKTVDNVFSTKFELADAVKKKDGKCFVNANSEEIIKRIHKTDYTLYGTNETSDFKIENVVCGRYGSEFTLKTPTASLSLSTKLLGMHSIINIAGASAIAYQLGLSEEEIKFAVASLKSTEHRLELKSGIKGSLLIDDAYNANPEGCIDAVHTLASFEGMKKAIITPGLIELGEKEYEYNYRLGLEASKYCDIMIFVGKNRSKPLVDGAKSSGYPEDKMFVASSFKEAMEIYSGFANNNWVLLIENDLPDNYLN